MRSHHLHVLSATLGVAVLLTSASNPVSAAKPQPSGLAWSGYNWEIKTSASPVGPGPNIFDRNNVTVDANGALHLKIAKNAAGAWTSAEIVGPNLGYGVYAFSLASRVDTLDANAVLGLFTWSDRQAYAHRELDIEFARWGNPSDPTNAQYVVQPYDRPGHLRRFTQPAATTSMHRFLWQPGKVDWESYTSNGLIDSYSYPGSDVPRAGDERVRINLWLFNGAAPTDGQPIEVVLSSFVFAR